MVKLNVSVNDDILLQLQSQLARLGAGSMPATARAMGTAAKIVQGVWNGFAGGGSLPGVEKLKNPSGAYARSIKIQRNGPFDYEIYSEAAVAVRIEHGTPQIDMKETHTRGPRSRVSKKGVPYLIVPFRWGTPNTVGFKNIMPESVYSIVKNKDLFKQSKTVVDAANADAVHTTPNARGELIGRAQYAWGDRLTADMGGEGNMEGMVSMEGQVEGGRKRASGYLTFRVISAASPKGSWIKPAMPARPVTQAVADTTRDTVGEIIDGALREDLGI